MPGYLGFLFKWLRLKPYKVRRFTLAKGPIAQLICYFLSRLLELKSPIFCKEKPRILRSGQ